jgi:glycosyltransferase involved in cell wall biosynthesis
MRLVILTSRFPSPPNQGDKLRILQQIKVLSEEHEICLIAVNKADVSTEDWNVVAPYCKEMHVFKNTLFDMGVNTIRAFFKGIPLQVGVFYQPAHHRKIAKIISDFKPDALYCHLIRMTEYCRDIKNVPKTLDFMDVFSMGAKRWHSTAQWYLKPILAMEYRRLCVYEKAVFDEFDHKTIITEQDRDLIPHPDFRQIKIIANGVDWVEFHPIPSKKNYDLLYMGYMGYAPNIEAACFFVEKVMPLLLKERPNLKLLIAGHTPHKRVLALASANVDVIPDWKYIRDSFTISRIMVAPMLISIGLQNKIIQSMAMKIPTICSRLANKAVKAPPSCIVEADSPEEYAAAIFKLLDTPQYYNDLAENAYQFVHENFDWRETTHQLEQLIFSTIQQKQAVSS